MKAIIRISDNGKWQDFYKSDLPLAVSILSSGIIVFGSDAELNPAVWFGLSNDKVFLQPEGGQVSTRLNDKELYNSAWLNVDDIIYIDDNGVTVTIEAGVFVLSRVPKRKVPVLTPPSSPVANAEQAIDISPPSTEQKSVETKQTEGDIAMSQPDTPGKKPPHLLPKEIGRKKDINPQPTKQKSVKKRLIKKTHTLNQPKVSADTSIALLPKKKVQSRLQKCIVFLFIFLLICVTFILIAVAVRIAVSPLPDSLSFTGFPPPIKFKDRYLALPGDYNIFAKKEGYHDLNETINVKSGPESLFDYKLIKLPGLLEVVTQPVSDAEVSVAGRVVGKTPLSAVELEAGRYELSIVSPRYLANVQFIEIQGMGVKLPIDVTLEPGWGTLQIDSEPEGSDVLLNSEVVGQTPLTIEPMGGAYTVELKKDGWKSVLQDIRIDPGASLILPKFKLQKADGILKLTSEPSGANVMLNNIFSGHTPVSLTISSDQEHQLILSKSGFMTGSRSIRVGQDKTENVHIQLEPEYGIVFIISQPADAKLTVDSSEVQGFASQRLRLTTVPHQIEVTKADYESFSTTITPTKGVSKSLNVELKRSLQEKIDAIAPELKTSEGQVLRKIGLSEPVQFEMGASRRESGRRSNEKIYQVELTRTFYISEKEVTNAEFQKFHQDHNSGNEQGFDLSENDQPVVAISWDQAVSYLNWLSNKDGLPLAYEEKDGKMIAIVPITTGYRLPTEVEWAFVARYEGGSSADKKPLKYSWGKKWPPPDNSGNYADETAINILPVSIMGYKDGFSVASPVGKFSGNAVGIYDLDGNVSEWCHDYYDIHTGSQSEVLRDPTGPANGEYHVVRGASWRHGSIVELRQSYRNYEESRRNDLGFRIVRYAE